VPDTCGSFGGALDWVPSGTRGVHHFVSTAEINSRRVTSVTDPPAVDIRPANANVCPVVDVNSSTPNPRDCTHAATHPDRVLRQRDPDLHVRSPPRTGCNSPPAATVTPTRLPVQTAEQETRPPYRIVNIVRPNWWVGVGDS